jgi:hypothetical protein
MISGYRWKPEIRDAIINLLVGVCELHEGETDEFIAERQFEALDDLHGVLPELVWPVLDKAKLN